MSDLIPIDKLRQMVYDEVYATRELPYYYYYIQSERVMGEALKLLTDYHHHEQSAKENSNFEYSYAVLKVFVESLTILLTTPDMMTVKNSCITRSKVYEKLMPYINCHVTIWTCSYSKT